MFIVLPHSVLGNKSLAAARMFIEQRARIAAVFSLPADTFGPSGAKSKTSVVLLEKRSEVAENVSEEDEVFPADVRHIGYDFTGRQTPQASQMPLVVDAFLAWKGGR